MNKTLMCARQLYDIMRRIYNINNITLKPAIAENHPNPAVSVEFLLNFHAYV